MMIQRKNKKSKTVKREKREMMRNYIELSFCESE